MTRVTIGAGKGGELFDHHEGRFVATRHIDGSIEVNRADPRILISAHLLDEVQRGEMPNITLRDDVLTIDGINQRVIYRIGEKVPDWLAYYAEWPD